MSGLKKWFSQKWVDIGSKRKDFKGSKPSGSKVASAARKVRTANKGKYVEIPKNSGMAIELVIDGNDSFVNPSAQAYYKDIL